MRFVPSVQRESTGNQPAWWFAFCDDNLLVKIIGEAAVVPLVKDLTSLGLRPLRAQYLGTLNDLPCYSAELNPDVSAPEGTEFRGLRGLFGWLEEDLFWLAGRAVQVMRWDQTHQFCGRCGAPTEIKPDERARICPECQLVAYPRLSPAIIVAVVKGDEILLARAHRFPHGLYSVIAGFVEPGENLEECLRREVREEVGIEVKSIRYFGSQPWPFPNSLMVGFTAEYDRGEIHVDEAEISDAGWFKVGNLPRIPDKVSIARQLIDWFVDNRA